MTVLHIVGSIDKSAGGPARSVTQTCEYVSRLGIEIEIVTQPSKNPVIVNTSSNYKITYLSINELFAFSKSLTKKQFAFIHLQHVWEPYIHIVARTARKKGIPYIITPRGMLEPWIMNRHPWKKKIAMWLYQRKDIEKAAYLHATCELEKENIRKLGFTNPIVVIPNGIEINNAKPKTQWQAVRNVLFVSRIHPKKGIELLIEAVAQLGNKQLQLTIAGEGEAGYVEELKQLCVRKKVSEQFAFVGGVYGEQKWELYHRSDLFVLPTYSENFGIVVAEALATGLPVITTTGTPWQELETEHCGWWIDLSVDHLAKVLDEALQLSPDELQAMGASGRKLVEDKYDIMAVARDMYEFYKTLL